MAPSTISSSPPLNSRDRATSLLPPSTTPGGNDDERLSASRMQLFMGTRLGVATLLLGGMLLITVDAEHDFNSFTPRFLSVLIGLIYLASLGFAIWLVKSDNRERVAIVQVGSDLLVTTGLVYITGGAGSGFTFLYGVAVLMAAMVIGPWTARLTGGAAISCFGAVVTGLATGVLAPPADQNPEAYTLPMQELAYASLLNVLGLLLVTVLASNLAGRLLKTGGRLRAAESTAASLVQLNDDIVRSLSSGLLTTDLSGRVYTINETGALMFGRNADDLVGVPVTHLLPVEKAQLEVSLQSNGTDRAEGHARRPDGSSFPAGYTLNPLLNAEGSAIGVLVVFQDLTEVTELRQTAQRAERMAVLGRLSAGLAHEIRNPLSSISGSVELVKDSRRLDQEDRHLLSIVLKEVERLNELVTTMLEVGRPRQPRRQPEDLREIVENVVEMAQRGPAETVEVGIEAHLPGEPVRVWADGAQIRQVLWNLVKNALQASPRGSRIDVETHFDAAGNGVLAVSDEGDGLSTAQVRKVYDMFYSERTQGAGIGLALVRQIVDAHGGSVQVESEHRRGAKFIVTLPARPPEQTPPRAGDGPHADDQPAIS